MTHENPQAPALSLLSICSSILSWISFAEAQYMLSFGATIIGILSGCFAIRYYYYAGNEKRNQINNNTNGE
jgi:hypothetical protein